MHHGRDAFEVQVSACCLQSAKTGQEETDAKEEVADDSSVLGVNEDDTNAEESPYEIRDIE